MTPRPFSMESFLSVYVALKDERNDIQSSRGGNAHQSAETSADARITNRGSFASPAGVAPGPREASRDPGPIWGGWWFWEPPPGKTKDDATDLSTGLAKPHTQNGTGEPGLPLCQRPAEP